MDAQPHPHSATPLPPKTAHPSAAPTGRRPWLRTIALALVPVVLTAAGQATAQATGASPAAGFLITAAAVALSALIGLLVAARRPGGLRTLGLRRPVGGWLWAVPATITVALAAATGGVHADLATAAAIALLCCCVAVNEEVFYRGLVIGMLRPWGVRGAVIASSVIFAVLHLSNLAGGASPTYAALQVVFAALFGLVAVEIYLITRSLWPATVWTPASTSSASPAATGSLPQPWSASPSTAWCWRSVPSCCGGGPWPDEHD